MDGLTGWAARATSVLPQTPSLLLRRSAFAANLAAMQRACDAAGVVLRPHGKMHKSGAVATAQMAAGAVGLCCQTVGEAEAFVAAGVSDVLVSAPVPPWGPPRLAALASSGVRVACVADSEAQFRRLSEAASSANVTLDVLVDVDLGQHRSGVAPEAAPALVAAAARASGVRWRGLQCYLGHLQPAADRHPRYEEATARLAGLVEDLRGAGHPPETVTGGGTGTHALDLAGGLFSELQAGSYAFMDAAYGADGAPFAQAIFVATAVVSAHHKTHATVDAGLKALAADGAPPLIAIGAPRGSRFRFQGDEHGAILHPAFLEALGAAATPAEQLATIDRLDRDPARPWPADAPRESDILLLVPGHIDPTVNLYDSIRVVDEDGGCEDWRIDARRLSPCP